jgi:hypothetical protein
MSGIAREKGWRVGAGGVLRGSFDKLRGRMTILIAALW